MKEHTNEPPADEEYQNIERTFREYMCVVHDDDQYFSHSQYRIVFDHLFLRVRKSAITDRISGDEYEARLGEAEKTIDDIASALSSGWHEKRDGWIWYKPALDNLVSRPTAWDDASPVDTRSLDAATARYLQRPWMQLNILDWYILNGYIFDEAARLADGMKSGQAVGIINWAHIFAGGDLEKTLYWRAGLAIGKFSARWILAPAIIAAAYYAGYIEVAKWIAIPYGIYLTVHMAFFPRRYLRRKALLKKMQVWEGRLNNLIDIYQSSSAEVFNPSRLRELIERAESERTGLKPAVYSILDRAISRDSAVFAVEERR